MSSGMIRNDELGCSIGVDIASLCNGDLGRSIRVVQAVCTVDIRSH